MIRTILNHVAAVFAFFGMVACNHTWPASVDDGESTWRDAKPIVVNKVESDQQGAQDRMVKFFKEQGWYEVPADGCECLYPPGSDWTSWDTNHDGRVSDIELGS